MFARSTFVIVFLMLSLGIDVPSWGQGDRGRVEKRFQQLDRDDDGELSATEFARGAELHRKIDRDRSGGVTLEEVRDYLRGGGILSPAAAPDAPPTEFLGSITDTMPITLESCRAAADYSARANGHAVLVMIDGLVVYERYTNGWNHATPHRLASGTKSFAGVVAAAAVQDGILTFDEQVSDTITEWKQDPQRSKITIRQLLTLSSGIEPGENSSVLSYDQAILAKAIDRPGRKFRYGPNAFQIFGELTKRKLAKQQQDYLEYLRDRILAPIGMETGHWRTTVDGDAHIPSGAFVTARQWAKFGELLRRGGQWEGKQLLRKDLLEQLTVKSKTNSRYGITFWLGVSGGAGDVRTGSIPSDMFMAAGAGKQRLFVIPSKQMVVVRLGETEGRKFQDREFLKRLLIPTEAD